MIRRRFPLTPVDYDDSDFVQRENIFWKEGNLSKGEAVDLGHDVIAAGDQVGIWSNARVIGHEGLGLG